MSGKSLLRCAVPVLLLSAACASPALDPYESCSSGDTCSMAGITCQGSTLGATSWTGALCTTTCTSNSDCPQDLSNYSAVCVFYAEGIGQCYLTCPGGSSTCPYGQSCFSYSNDYNGGNIELCTP